MDEEGFFLYLDCVTLSCYQMMQVQTAILILSGSIFGTFIHVNEIEGVHGKKPNLMKKFSFDYLEDFYISGIRGLKMPHL